MKTKIYFFISLLFSLCFNYNLIAQESGEKQESFFKNLELRGGLGGFWHSSTPTINDDPEKNGEFSGYNAAGWQLVFDLVINQHLGFSTGFKTAAGEVSSDSVFSPRFLFPGRWQEVNYDFQEWEIPLRFRYYLTKGRVQPFIDASISFNRFSRFTHSGIRYDPPDDLDGVPFSMEESSETNASYDIGIGLNIYTAFNLSISADLRYQSAELYWRENVKEIILRRPVIGFSILYKLYQKE